MRSKRDRDREIEEVEEVEELSEKQQKKLKHKEATQKRKDAKRKDKVARWGGIILLGLMMFIGFLLWVAGEMRGDNKSLNQNTIKPFESQNGSIIVK
jgi:hypothetical protein